jgi:hypothetical protein
LSAQTSPVVPTLAPSVLTAVPADHAPVIDGRDDDAVWRKAEPASGFRVFDPIEDGDPAFRTEVRAAFDQHTLYFFVRMFDPEPAKILPLLSRRDVKTQSDQIKVMIDSYHDRRSGFEFAVNPAGVKRDYYTYDDSREDLSWDAVWDVATRIDSLGWTAEFRIPLSQLRYAHAAEHTFGLMVVRDIGRTNERDAWPLLRRSKSGIASQFGEMVGLTGLGSPHRLELTPYMLSKNVGAPRTSGFARSQQQSVGADVKYGITSNLTLDATVNPDFGQVEADPAELNLTAFESFFEERRPFFLEGSGIFQFGPDPTRLFYARRIGRPPQLSGRVSDPGATIPASSTILGAAKITGRLPIGTSLGVLAAETAREAVGATTVEPQTEYGVIRATQDFRRGESAIGGILTVVDRHLDPIGALLLRSRAIAGGIDARHRFLDGKYSLSGTFAGSVVTGTAPAIGRTQRNTTHLYNRPDGGLPYDTTLTSLRGTSFSIQGDKTAGTYRYHAIYERLSPGFETNDIGFLGRADRQIAQAYATVQTSKPGRHWRNADAFASVYGDFTASGMPTTNTLELDGEVQFTNYVSLAADAWTDNQFTALCDRCARGGPALRLSPTANLLVNLSADPRPAMHPTIAAIYTVADGGRTTLWRVRPYVTVRSRSNLSWELGTRYQRNRDNTQWYSNYGVIGSDTTHYVFAHLDQELLSFTARLNYTASTTTSLQLYAEPFVTTGRYFRVREMARPRASDYDARFKPFALPSPPDAFNVKQFHSSAVWRWEYRPGSTVFLVWTQGRDQGERDPGSFLPARDLRNLFAARPDNTFLVKASYWFNL